MDTRACGSYMPANQGAHVVCLRAGARDTLMHYILLWAAACKDSAATCEPNTHTVLYAWQSLTPSFIEDMQCSNCAERETLQVKSARALSWKEWRRWWTACRCAAEPPPQCTPYAMSICHWLNEYNMGEYCS